MRAGQIGPQPGLDDEQQEAHKVTSPICLASSGSDTYLNDTEKEWWLKRKFNKRRAPRQHRAEVEPRMGHHPNQASKANLHPCS